MNTWYDVNNIVDHMKYHFLIPKVVRPYEAAQYLYHEYEEESNYGYSYKQKFYIQQNRYHKSIDIPFIKGSLFLFAAMGILDIAYDLPDVETMGKTCNCKRPSNRIFPHRNGFLIFASTKLRNHALYTYCDPRFFG